MKTINYNRLTILLIVILVVSINSYSQNEFNVRVEGLKANDIAYIIAQRSSEIYLKQMVIGDGSLVNELNFNLSDGNWAFIIDTKGYTFPSATVFDVPAVNSALIKLTPMLNNDFTYTWQDDDSYVGHATQSYISEPSVIKVLDKDLKVPNNYSSIELRNKYGIILSDDIEKWTTEDSYRIYKMFSDLPYGTFGEGRVVNPETGENIRGIFKLTKDEQSRDLTISTENGIKTGVFSQSAFYYASPQIVTIDGIKGKFFSKRLYHAIVNFVTDFATNESVVNWIAQERFGVKFMNSNQELENLMSEDASNFQGFFSEEKIEILSMFEELPEGFHKQEGFKYLVRRINGQPNPKYPNAAAVSWTGLKTMEFMEVAFNVSNLNDTRRLILHEKTHFLWEYMFDNTLKNDWADLGGWFEDPTSASGWSTSNTTEFVSPYSHDLNPNEDMAESVAFYLQNPDRLKSVSLSKYEFIRDRIMHGTRYIAQIREDLTFMVYNLFPDYTYPGKVTKVEVKVVGESQDDKEVTIRVKLNSENPEMDGASSGYIRFASILGTIHDVQLGPEKGSQDSILVGTTTFSKFEKNGYWSMASFSIKDIVGNQRYENTSTVGMKLYIENPLEDVTPPRWNNDFKMEIVEGKYIGDFGVSPNENGEQMRAIKLSYSFYDDNPLQRSLSRMIIANSNYVGYEKYSHDIQSNQPFNAEHQLENGHHSYKYFEMYLRIPDYFQSGFYSTTFSNATDIGGNNSSVYYVKDTSDFHINPLMKNAIFKDIRDSIYIETKYPDYIKPEIDLNNILVNATPTKPLAPDGETRVDISLLARDLSDYIGKESGVCAVQFVLRDPLGIEHGYQTGNATMNHPQLSYNAIPGNTSEWKIFNFDFLLPKGSPPGKWGISSASVQDRAGNMKKYSFVEYVRFDVIESDLVLTKALDTEITDKLVNAANVDKIDIKINCAPSQGLKYVYTIYSLMGGNVVRAEGIMTSDEMVIQGIDTRGVLDGIIKLTVQLTDATSRLIATKTVEYTKDTQRPSAYYTRSNLQNQGISNLDDVVLEIVFEKSEIGGTYEFSIEDLYSSNASSSSTNLIPKFNSSARADALIIGTIDSGVVALGNLNLTRYIDKVIMTRVQVTDTCMNVGEWVESYFSVKADGIIQIDNIISSHNLANNTTFSIYQNPIVNELIIESALNNPNSSFEIINSIGQVVYSGKLLQKTIVNTSSLTHGVHIVKLNIDRNVKFKKIIIQ